LSIDSSLLGCFAGSTVYRTRTSGPWT